MALTEKIHQHLKHLFTNLNFITKCCQDLVRLRAVLLFSSDQAHKATVKLWKLIRHLPLVRTRIFTELRRRDCLQSRILQITEISAFAMYDHVTLEILFLSQQILVCFTLPASFNMAHMSSTAPEFCQQMTLLKGTSWHSQRNSLCKSMLMLVCPNAFIRKHLSLNPFTPMI